MNRIVFLYKGRYWVREARTLETLSALARASGHKTSLAYDRDLFGVSDNVLSLPWLNRRLFDPRAAAKKAAAANPSWIILLENLTNRAWIEETVTALRAAGYRGRTAVLACSGSFGADVNLYGEPEKVFSEFLKALPNPPAAIRTEGLVNLDLLPLPDMDLFSRYEDLGASYMAYAGKGCSGACSYCEEPFHRAAYGPGYARLRSPARVIEELVAAKERFGTREITFKDSVFTADQRWLAEFLWLYREKVGLPFKCFGRSDAFNLATAVLLRDAGCYCVEFGLQTFNEELRTSVLRRPETLAAVRAAFSACDAAGLPYDVDYIFGLPGESVTDHLEAAQEFSRLKRLNRIKCHNLVYYKGLKITEYALKEGWVSEEELGRGDFFSGDRSVPSMRADNSAFRKLFKVSGLIGGAGLAFAARTGLWRLFRFLPGILVKLLELLAGLLRGDKRFLTYLRTYPARVLGRS